MNHSIGPAVGRNPISKPTPSTRVTAIIIIAAVGVGLLIWGLRNWSRRQRVLNGLEDAELAKSQLGLVKATPAETDSKARYEVLQDGSVNAEEEPDVEEPRTSGKPRALPVAPDEPVEGAAVESPLPRAAGAGGEPRPNARIHADRLVSPVRDEQRRTFAGARRDYAEVERLVKERVAAVLKGSHVVESQLKLTGTSSTRMTADMVALATRDGYPDVVVEVKYVRHAFPPALVQQVLLQTGELATMLHGRSRTVCALVVFVLGDDDEIGVARGAIKRSLARSDDLFPVSVGAFAISLSELRRGSVAVFHKHLLVALPPLRHP